MIEIPKILLYLKLAMLPYVSGRSSCRDHPEGKHGDYIRSLLSIGGTRIQYRIGLSSLS